MTSLLQSRLYQIGNKSNLHFGLMKTPQPASWVCECVGWGGGGGEETGGMGMGVPTERVVHRTQWVSRLSLTQERADGDF